MLDLKKIYEDWLRKGNDLHQKKRYQGKEEWFHASASGMCMRKHYFQHVADVEPKEIDDDTMRLFRLGDLVHEDIQSALKDYARINGSQIMIEREIRLPEVNVRGFLDVIIVEDDALYDIKTCNAWKWKSLFGRNPDPNPAVNYNIQLGTYGWWFEEHTGNKLKKLALLYYNKDNSMLRYKEVSKDRLLTALGFWERINKQHSNSSLPTLQDDVSPVATWECQYCSFKDRCQEDANKGL